MIASVLVEYNLKHLDKVFDYKIPNKIEKDLKVGNKVLVPFGNKQIEGFVLKIHNNYDKNITYKEIINIIEKDFVINPELLELGRWISEKTISPLILCYQIMFPKAYKANHKTTINKKYEIFIEIKDSEILEKYLRTKKVNKQQIEIINIIKDQKKVLKSQINCSSLKTLIKNNILKEIKEEKNRQVYFNKEEIKKIKLTEDQKKAYLEITRSENKKVLLHGVTGSGKTEIYIKLIKDCLNKYKTAIFLVPEISLTPQIITRLNYEFEDNVAILHSKLSEGEKYDEYRKILKEKVKLVVGARSAVFAPLKNIGLIIIDECSSASYKQENTPKYNAIDIALERGNNNNALVVMGSATPLLEQYARGLKNIFKLVKLDTRINNKLPHVSIVNMEDEIKKRNTILSQELRDKIKDRIEKKEQTILLLNRRGYSTYISCSACGYVYKCPNCDISLIYHKTTNNLRCHYCGYSTQMSEKCPKCSEKSLLTLGMGTEKLENYIQKEFPNARVLRMDTDTTSKKGSHEKLIQSFKNRDYDILVGTQMISKGLNFPYVTLVGVINADNSLNIPDFRSNEKTFEMLMQTSGRSGRNELPGEVIIQTFNPDNYVFKCIKDNNYVKFYNYEMQIRKALKYPPYYYLVQMKISGLKYETVRDESKKIKQFLETNLSKNFIILGPSTSNILKLNNKYYFNIIIKYKKEENIYEVLKKIVNNYIRDQVNIDINMNPLITI